LNCNRSNARRVSRPVMTSVIALMMGETAFAQNPHSIRLPRNASAGKIDLRNRNVLDAGQGGNPNLAQGPGPGPVGPGPGCNLFPAPASVGATVNLSYFGPPPSSVNRSLVGPVQLLNTGPVDSTNGTITIPLYLGHMLDGKTVWYILSDVDDSDVAAELG